MNRAQLAAIATEIQQSLPTKEWDAVPELKKFRQSIEVKSGDKRNMKFDELVVAYKTYDAEIKFRESKKSIIKEAIEAAMLVSGEEAVECEGYPVNLITKKGSRKISAERLLGAGVDADVIARCTEVGAELTYVQIGKAKKDK